MDRLNALAFCLAHIRRLHRRGAPLGCRLSDECQVSKARQGFVVEGLAIKFARCNFNTQSLLSFETKFWDVLCSFHQLMKRRMGG